MVQRELLQVKSELRHLDLEAKSGQTGRATPQPQLSADELEDRLRVDPTVLQSATDGTSWKSSSSSSSGRP